MQVAGYGPASSMTATDRVRPLRRARNTGTASVFKIAIASSSRRWPAALAIGRPSRVKLIPRISRVPAFRGSELLTTCVKARAAARSACAPARYSRVPGRLPPLRPAWAIALKATAVTLTR